MFAEEIVITGIGIACPLGMGKEAVWEAVSANCCGIGPLNAFDAGGLPARVVGAMPDFAPRNYVKSRKSLKFMSRDAQLGVVASILACRDATISADNVGPERFGVVQGADLICGGMEESHAIYAECIAKGRFSPERWGVNMVEANPLSFLQVLPNMIASLVSIEHDARGPNNTIHEEDVSSLHAIIEATRVIQRGAAEVMIAGGASSMLKPFDWVRHCLINRLSPSQEEPNQILRPFDADRDGQVWGEGAASLVLERRDRAEQRGAKILGTIRGWGSIFQPIHSEADRKLPLVRAMRDALGHAGCDASEIGHVNAQGLSTVLDDQIEAQAIAELLPRTPVTAPKSYFGNLGAAGGTAELALSLIGMEHGVIPPTRNYETPDPKCPISVVAGSAAPAVKPTGLALNWTSAGQATALVFSGAEA